MSALNQKIIGKTDHELMFYINNVDKHTEEAVHLALAELKSRGIQLPETIDDDIQRQLDAKTVLEHQKNRNAWKSNVVENLEAPQYYSKNAIYVFSILFSTFFGSFMLASNCKDAGKPGWPVILFGLFYSVIAVAILNYFNANSPFTFIASGIGVLAMYELFWARHIGADTQYRAKPIWKPLIIAAIIFVPLTALMIYSISSQK
ncbi:hypothetical protein [Pedobacter heparinus]|uniref:Uncharacterized protein n=1 Tax=Pedobacter heparinus (strain ATCC 13125 / DSM 2366 / CIP 104194 / JCM 7457 / NBRC 12017 / NCIMB 9290 / NRRL B-14731 / HIM 762-3) TaxID=485917 RepID=C6Y3J3_PEDHD|nr:hypothetical protein [Pedobacter heparinus]ACU03272.1 hypothetical protein Phep_1053 [Pedobacter heparinus DSM 2366]